MMRIIEDAFFMQQKISPNFLLHKKRSAKDAHSREKQIVACATRARRENLASEILFYAIGNYFEFSIA